MNSKNDNGTICSMAWNHQFTDPTGRVKPCCRFAEKISENINQKSLKEIFYGEKMELLRQNMINGIRSPGCRRCYEEQDGGKDSLRVRYNRRKDLGLDYIDIENPNISWLEMAMSNDCNLICRMCDSRYAWKWIEDEKTLGYKPHVTERVAWDITNVYEFLPTIKHLKITGGEPLVTPQLYTVLNKIVESGYAKNISLNFSSNCSIFPKNKLIELFKQFDKVEFALSWDSANKYEAEYIRYPAKYELLEKTTIKFMQLHQTLPNFEIMCRPTVSIHNIYYIKETIDWWYKSAQKYYKEIDPTYLSINPTHVTFPSYLSLPVLPEKIRDRISSKLQDGIKEYKGTQIETSIDYLINFMYSKPFNIELLKELKHYNLTLDKSRGQDFFKSFPHFYDIFDDLAG